MKSPVFVLAFALLPLVSLAQDATKTLRVYFVGNSVTDTIRYEPFAKLAASRGHQLIWGRHMIPGAPLQWLWDHPAEGFKQDPFGYPREALTQHTWDVLSLQPFDRQLTSKDDSDDVTKIRQYCELAAPRSPELQVYLCAPLAANHARRQRGPVRQERLRFGQAGKRRRPHRHRRLRAALARDLQRRRHHQRIARLFRRTPRRRA